MDLDLPECSHISDQDDQPNHDQKPSPIGENDNDVSLNLRSAETPTPVTPKSFSLASTLSEVGKDSLNKILQISMPLILRPSYQSPIICQPRSLQSPIQSLVMRGQPPSLFLQALNKFESSLSEAGFNHLMMLKRANDISYQMGDVTPPDSLENAPPSYSFVLRQMTVRRRPRLMGTFIPSPSFVQHTPPPTYATAFDIYIDNHIPPPTQRVYNFGFTSMPAVCPECGFTGMTVTSCKITMCTHVCAVLLCLFCCWICVPLPYILKSCKDVYHYCRNCRTYLGMYCPTNPESTY